MVFSWSLRSLVLIMIYYTYFNILAKFIWINHKDVCVYHLIIKIIIMILQSLYLIILFLVLINEYCELIVSFPLKNHFVL